VEIAGARTSRTTGSVADTDRDIVDDTSELDFQILFFLFKNRRSIFYYRI
jgi:hypothetical protein